MNESVASNVLHRVIGSIPEKIVDGDGVWLVTADGRRVMDGCSGAAVACLGHKNRSILDAIKANVETHVAFVHSSAFTNEPAEELARYLLGDRAGGLSRALFVSSGSEAMDNAMKIARQYHYTRGDPGRVHFIARNLSYHGNTLGGLSLGGNPPRRAPYEDILLPHVSHVSPCYYYRFGKPGESQEEYGKRLCEELEAEFQRVGPHKVAAFVLEPFVGATTGCVGPVPGYLKGVAEIVHRHGALLIYDEVMCGMGRTGKLHAWQWDGVPPDIQTIGKGLGGGYAPISGVLLNDNVVAGLGSVLVSGHTYQAHPLACATALAVQTYIQTHELRAQVGRQGEYLQESLHRAFQDAPYVGDIRGRGLFYGLEFVQDRQTKQGFPDGSFAARMLAECRAEGVCVYPGKDDIILAPPYTITQGEIDTMVGMVAAAYQTVSAEYTHGSHPILPQRGMI